MPGYEIGKVLAISPIFPGAGGDQGQGVAPLKGSGGGGAWIRTHLSVPALCVAPALQLFPEGVAAICGVPLQCLAQSRADDERSRPTC